MDSSHFIGFQEQVEKVKHLRRTGWIVRGVPNPETVGAHSWRMAMMALQLSDKIEADGASVDRVICLCLMHDIAESVIGDIIPEEFQTGPKITAAVKHRRESEAVNFLSGNYSFPLFKSCFNEYEAGRTAAGKWAAELDKLDMVLQAYEYYERYPLINSLMEFMSFNEKRFQTPIGQAIIGEIKRRWYDGVCREGDEADKVIAFQRFCGRLKSKPDTLVRQASIPDGASIADHCFRAAVMAWQLRRDIVAAGGTVARVVRLILTHHLGQAVTGNDSDGISSNPTFKKQNSYAIGWLAARYQVPFVQIQSDEFEAGETIHARLAAEIVAVEHLGQACDYMKRYPEKQILLSEIRRNIPAIQSLFLTRIIGQWMRRSACFLPEPPLPHPETEYSRSE